MVTVERLREALTYDPLTGVLTWRITVNNNKGQAGEAAGYLREDGYVEIALDGSPYRAHRIAWALAYGVWPKGLLDHKNGVRHDNRIDNLRPTTRALNLQNQRGARSNSKSGLLGVTATPRANGPAWRATIKVDGRQVHLGTFPSPELAHAAYVEAKRRLHPACTI